jgi:hypothetical protein
MSSINPAAWQRERLTGAEIAVAGKLTAAKNITKANPVSSPN